MKIALVPFRNLCEPKTRLATILTLEQRQSLALAMLRDVLEVLATSHKLDSLAMVSSDSMCLNIGKNNGFTPISEPDSPGESVSVDRTIQILKRNGAKSVLVIPADVPLITSREIDEIVDMESEEPSTVIIPSRDLDGTNGLMRNPPDLFPSHYGKSSFKKHISEAKQIGVTPKIREFPGLGLDIDTPEDLAIFTTQNITNHTSSLMKELSIPGYIQNQQIF